MKNSKRIVLKIFFFLIIILSAAAEDPFTGWKQAETEHFLFIYEERDRAAVEELLSFCEEVYAKVTGFIESAPPKIECIVRGRTDVANGFFTPLPGKLELFVTAPQSSWALGSRTESWLKLLLTHELTHYVHLIYQKGFVGVMGNLFGTTMGGIFMGAGTPGWVTEGLTTNTETIFTDGGRGRSAFFEMYYKAPVIEKNLFSLGQASYSSVFAPRGRIYVAGYMIIDYLLKEFGREKVAAILESYASSLNWDGAVKEVTGKDMELIYRNMQGDLTVKYREDALLPDGMRLSPRVHGSWYFPVITEQGWYLYRRTLAKQRAIIFFDPASGQEKELVRTSLTDTNSLTAPTNGEVLVFAARVPVYGHPAGAFALSELFEHTPATGQTRQITKEGHLWHPAISPDGSRLVAVQGQGSFSILVEVNRKTGDIRPLFTRAGSRVYDPSFSPDGKTLVFLLNTRGVQNIYSINLTEAASSEGYISEGDFNLGAARPVILSDSSAEYYPRFLDDRRILFSSDIEGSLKLYELSLDNPSEFIPVAADPVGAYRGAYDKDGRLIYGSYSTEGFSLKTPAADMIPGSSVVIPGESFAAPVVETVLPLEESKGYLSLPRLAYWLPFPTLYQIPAAPANFTSDHLGFGAVFYSLSNLEDLSLESQVEYFPVYEQFRGYFSFSGQLNTLGYNYRLVQQFSDAAGDWSQTMDHTMSVSHPIVRLSELSSSFGLNGAVGTGYTYTRSEADSFGFFTTPAESNVSRTLSAFGGVSLYYNEVSSDADFYEYNDFRATLSGTVLLPALSRTQTDFGLSGFLGGTFRLPWNHHHFRWGLKNAFSSESKAHEMIAVRGNAPWNGEDSDLYGIGALEYLVSLPPMDMVIGSGFSLQGMGLGFHLEEALGYSYSGGLLWDNSFYAGAECSFILSFHDAAQAFTFGVNAKIEPLAGSVSFYPYLTLGTHSF